MLQDRVAVITGAGRGIGREHALLFASLGAKVVVNDLGGAVDGSGADVSAAQAVVDEITAAGGQAVANTDSVSSFEGAKALVDQAVSTFGDLHVVVNNAGILRDRMLVSMSEQEFDDVIAVHLKGTFNVTRHAAGYWREAAKEGDDHRPGRREHELGCGAARQRGPDELLGRQSRHRGHDHRERHGAAPLRGARQLHRPGRPDRLTMQTPGMEGPMQQHVFDPENVSPLVAVLAAETCPFNGQVFSVYGGSVGIYAGWSIAESVETDDRWTPESLADAMDALPRTVEVTSQMAQIASTWHTEGPGTSRSRSGCVGAPSATLSTRAGCRAMTRDGQAATRGRASGSRPPARQRTCTRCCAPWPRRPATSRCCATSSPRTRCSSSCPVPASGPSSRPRRGQAAAEALGATPGAGGSDHVARAPDELRQIYGFLAGSESPGRALGGVPDRGAGAGRGPIPADPRGTPPRSGRSFRCAVIGAGASGIAAAHRLRQAGVDVTVFEKNDGVGGTWHENVYPGCRVDVPNQLYSFSFAQTNDWVSQYSAQPDLLAYLQRVAEELRA